MGDVLGLSQIELTVLVLVAGSLAAFRLAYALVYEKGFLAIFQRIRTWAGVRIVRTQVRDTLGNISYEEHTVGETTMAEIFTCYYCCSMWTSMPFGVLAALTFDYGPLLYPAVWFVGIAFFSWLAICGAALIWKGFMDA